MIQEAGTHAAGLQAAGPAPGELKRWLGAISFTQIIRAVDRVGTTTGSAAVIALYEQWIASQPTNHPYLFAAWFNLGVEYGQAGRQAEAVMAYGSALGLRPGFHAAAINLGLILESLGQPDAALQTWEQALLADGDGNALLLSHCARLRAQFGPLAQEGQGSALDPPGGGGPLDPAP